jgi:hypothetical protein
MRIARSTYAFLLLTWAALMLAVWPISVHAASGLSGRWHVVTSIRCVSSGYNLAACQRIAGSQFAAFSVQGATLTIESASEYLVDARGHFTGHGSSTITERVAGHGALADCAPDQIVNVAWTGVCYTAWSGRGHLAKGKTGSLDFWPDNGTTTMHGAGPMKPHRINFHLSSDSRIPAVVGVYTTARFFQFLHLAPVRGISIRTVVTHSS